MSNATPFTALPAPETGTVDPATRVLAVRTSRTAGDALEHVWPVDAPLVEAAPPGTLILADGPAGDTTQRYRDWLARHGLPVRNAPWVAYWRPAYTVNGTDEDGEPTTVEVPAGWHTLRLPREARDWAAVEAAIAGS